jgi:ribosome-binding protein aMBF1 (putative translation factor)
MNWKEHKKTLLKDPAFRKALKETKIEYEIARAIILARAKHDLTQKELAKKLNTKQSVISRLENAQTTPSLTFLKRLAAVFGAELEVRFVGM